MSIACILFVNTVFRYSKNEITQIVLDIFFLLNF